MVTYLSYSNGGPGSSADGQGVFLNDLEAAALLSGEESVASDVGEKLGN
jgi:hypothetical protein